MAKKGEVLTPKQKLFCELYASDREFFGNGVQSYIEAYDVDVSKPGKYKVAQTEASRMLSKPLIFNYINELLDIGGLNDISVDKQLSYVIHQHDDKASKVAAIREYNKLKNRIQDKMDINLHLPKPILESVLSNDINKENSEAN